MTLIRISDREFGGLVIPLACAIYLVGYAGYSLSDTLGDIRYLVYATPLILLAFLPFQHRLPHVSFAAIAFFIAYVSIGVVDYFAGDAQNEFFLINFVIISLVLLCFIPQYNVSLSSLRIVFLFSLAYFIIAIATSDVQNIRLFSILRHDTLSALDEGYDNHQGGLVGPIYSVFAAATGDGLQFLLAIILSVLGGKRIGVVAIVIGIAAVLLFRKMTILKNRQNRFIALLCILGLINIVASHLTTISDTIYENLNVNVPIEEIMLGRHAVGVEMTHILESRSLAPSLIGFGPGSADALAALVTDGDLREPHNDWMKILYDYGVIGSMVITTFIAIIFSSSATSSAIAITSAVIMTTDNVFIYLYYQFPIALMVAYSRSQDSSRPEAPGKAGWRIGLRPS